MKKRGGAFPFMMAFTIREVGIEELGLLFSFASLRGLFLVV